ncbi:uncharacterized protein BYT42DRAFT_531231 [Radiomyces spectabilis]|uniref:uncharacterized protein n=1 Tax=Radiomyces spectabilis TaxID=64574 RepID=UPI0022201EDE|nr:uncharacterized protein BYT42DRAFT_531231 [Radiomyces spectabilis]KAI8381389.1 hypothetical protein BYT42DRAFT_531231 [Radiomyces spectabilis]
MTTRALAVKRPFTELAKLKILTRPRDTRSEVTVYVKGFLAEGEAPENFEDWLHSHRLLALSPQHRWGPAALGYSWPSGSPMSHIPIPLASLGTAAYFLARSWRQVGQLRWLTPASLAGALAVDIGLHAGRLAYQFHRATDESRERAEMLAWRLLQLRRQHDTLRVVGHSLGCRHIVEACALMQPCERPDAVHLCAPALIASDILPSLSNDSGGLGRQATVIYYSSKDLTLGILLRAILFGDQAVGEIGLPPCNDLHPSVITVDASRSLGGYYIGAHTDYANKFHYFAHPRIDVTKKLLS